jgi:hypothetical protein
MSGCVSKNGGDHRVTFTAGCGPNITSADASFIVRLRQQCRAGESADPILCRIRNSVPLLSSSSGLFEADPFTAPVVIDEFHARGF